MAIYYDYSTSFLFEGKPTGIPRTVACLAKAFKKELGEIEFIHIDDKIKKFKTISKSLTKPELGEDVIFKENDIFFSAGANWQSACYLDELNKISAKGVKIYILFYDFIPTKFPYYYEQGEEFGEYYKYINKSLFGICDYAFAISNATRSDMIELLELNNSEASRIDVVKLGDTFAPHYQGKLDLNKELTEIFQKPYILSVGTIEGRKNHNVILQAYRLLLSKGIGDIPNLVIAGRLGWQNNSIKFVIKNDPILKNKVHILESASDKLLDSLYTNCLFTVYPSFYEGWGLPITESLNYNKVCICSDTSSMREVAPELTIFASPYNAHQWEEKIASLVFNKSLLLEKERLIELSYKPQSWRGTARAIIKKFIK